jgi:Peptidase family M23
VTALPDAPQPLSPLSDSVALGEPLDLRTVVRVAAHARGTAGRTGTVLVVGGLLLRVLPLPSTQVAPAVATAAGVVGLALLLLAVVLGTTSPSAARQRAHPLAPPLPGRPVPLAASQGAAARQATHAYGRAFAVDLVLDEDPPAEDEEERATGSLARLGLRRPEEFGSFGQPVLAVADATVVRVVDGMRDHRSRSSRLARALSAVGGAVRELCGTRAVLGNHVVLDLGGGRYAVCAHLQRRSAVVAVGDRVLPGQPIGACGSSGSATQPHLQLLLLDDPNARVAAGLPFTLRA